MRHSSSTQRVTRMGDAMNFGEVLKHLKGGGVATRKGWGEGTIGVAHDMTVRDYACISTHSHIWYSNHSGVISWVPDHEDLLAEDWVCRN